YSARSGSRYPSLPSAMVARTRPGRLRPRSGEFFPFERSDDSLTSQASSGSKRTRSAGSPIASAGRGLCWPAALSPSRTRAGPARRPRIRLAGLPRPAARTGEPLVAKRDVMRRDVACNRKPRGLGPPDELNPPGGGDMGEVQSRGGRVGSDQVAEDRDVAGD